MDAAVAAAVPHVPDGAVHQVTMGDHEVNQRRAAGRRLAFVLALVAIAVYVGFMFLQHFRG